jgi:hypothetical protein
VDRQYVGIDFHRRRSVIVRLNADGERLATTRVANDVCAIAAAVTGAGPEPEVGVITRSCGSPAWWRARRTSHAAYFPA